MLLDIEFKFVAPLFEFFILLYREFCEILILFDKAIFFKCIFYTSRRSLSFQGFDT